MFTLFSDYTTPESWIIGMASMRPQDFFTREALYDALPCLGLPLTYEVVEGLVERGDLRLVIPAGNGAMGTYCLASRVSDSEVKQLWPGIGAQSIKRDHQQCPC